MEAFCRLLTRVEEQIAPPKRIGLRGPQTMLPDVLHHESGGLLGALIPILQLACRKLLANHELDALGDRRRFISVLEFAHRAILGDDEEKFTRMLQK